MDPYLAAPCSQALEVGGLAVQGLKGCFAIQCVCGRVVLHRDVTRGPYEPYVRHRHTAPAYRTGCQLESWHPYPVSGRLFTVYSRTLTSVYGRHTDHSSEHTGALVVTRLPSFLARSPSSISATCHYLSIFVRRLFLSHFPHFFFL